MKEVKSCMFYEKGQCALSGSCALTDCEFKHHLLYQGYYGSSM